MSEVKCGECEALEEEVVGEISIFIFWKFDELGVVKSNFICLLKTLSH